MSYLGLDLGTSSLKAIVIDEHDAVLAQASVPLEVARPRPGWSEQAPEDWTRAAEAAIGALYDKVDLAAVRGIGLSGHMHGATVLGGDDVPLRPCIMWNDTRSAAEAAALDGDPRFREITGNIVFPGFTAPKIAWMQAHEPDLFEKIAKVLLPKDYLRLWLTGETVSEMSDASGTSWLDVGARDWSEPLLEATGLTRDAMPRLVEGSEVSGQLRGDLAQRLGLTAGIPVAGGAGDNAAAAVGLGVTAPGQAFVSLGTSGVVFAPTDAFRPAPETAVHAFCHALPGVWHQMGVILAATDALNWLARFTGRSPGDLARSVTEVRAPGELVFLPYLGGERTPLNDAAIRGGFLGLAHDTDAEAATRAVMEGVAFALADCVDALGATGTRIERMLATGGGAQSEAWLQTIATVTGIPVDVPGDAETGAALGAARLGRMAATGEGADSLKPPRIAREIEPLTDLAGAYAQARARFLKVRDFAGSFTG